METQNGTGKKKIHYAIWIFIGCCFTNAGFFALTANLVSVFIGYASAGVNAGPGDWAFNSTLGHIAGIVTAPILGRWMQSGHFKGVAIFSLLCIVFKFYGIALATELWQVYLLGLLAGTGSTLLMTMLEPNLIGNWFAPHKRSKYLAIAETCTGLGTLVWAPVFAAIVNAVGYRYGYAICASTILLMCGPWVFFVFKFRPEEKGLEPYGYDPNDENQDVLTGNKALTYGLSAKKVLRQPVFWIMFIVMMFTALRMGFNSYQTAIATESLAPQGFDAKTCAMIGATMVSTAAFTNAGGKLIFGWIFEKIGPSKSILIFGIISVLSFLTFIFFRQYLFMLYFAAFLLGSYNCLQSVGFPLVLRLLFGNRDFAIIYSYICIGTGFGGSIGNSIVGWFYQFTGTYTTALWYGLITAGTAAVLALYSCKRIGKIKWDHTPETEGDAPTETAAATV